jgi:lysophospholipid acyltransferase (LPLAT)-like uncharacterized protein
MGLREMGWGGMNCINLSQNRDQWRVLVHMVKNLLKGKAIPVTGHGGP